MIKINIVTQKSPLMELLLPDIVLVVLQHTSIFLKLCCDDKSNIIEGNFKDLIVVIYFDIIHKIGFFAYTVLVT